MADSAMAAPRLLTAVGCILQARAPTVAALDHIGELLDAFLDGSGRFSLEAAAANGSTALFERVIRRTLGNSDGSINDKIIVEHRLSRALEAAVERGHLAVVQRIQKACPQPLSTRVLRLAACYGDVSVMQWLLRHRTDGLCISDVISCDTSDVAGRLSCCMHHVYQHAINNKHLRLIRWLYENGYIDTLRGAGDAAAMSDDLEMVQWIHAQNMARSFSASAIDNAVRAGNIEIVKFLIKNRSDGCTSAAVNDAILGSHDEALELLRANGILTEDVPWALVREAGELGRLDILKWDHYAMHDARYLDSAMSAAAENGHLHVAQWLARNRNVTCRLAACAWAASRGHLNILKWVNNEGNGDWGVEIMDRAAQSGRLKIVEWLHTHRREGCSTFAMDGAAANGHLEMVKWLHANRTEGCTTSAMDRAAANGHLHVVEWLHFNRLEGCTTVAMDRAAILGRQEVVEWLHANRSEGCSTEAMDGAAAGGHLDMVIWLHTHRTEGCTTKAIDFGSLHTAKWLHWNRTEGCTNRAMNRAANNGDLPLLQFLHEHRKEGCTAEAAVQAAKNGHLYVVQWLQEKYPDVFDPARVNEALKVRSEKIKRRH